MMQLQEDLGVQAGQVGEADLEVGDLLPEKNKLKHKSRVILRCIHIPFYKYA